MKQGTEVASRADMKQTCRDCETLCSSKMDQVTEAGAFAEEGKGNSPSPQLWTGISNETG